MAFIKNHNSEILYAASKRMIFKITPDSISIIKSLPTPSEEFGWFPLAVGNRWAYNSYSIEEGIYGGWIYTFIGTKYMEVTKDTLIENKKYFVVENEYISFEVFPPRMFLRVDSLTGFIYQILARTKWRIFISQFKCRSWRHNIYILFFRIIHFTF